MTKLADMNFPRLDPIPGELARELGPECALVAKIGAVEGPVRFQPKPLSMANLVFFFNGLAHHSSGILVGGMVPMCVCVCVCLKYVEGGMVSEVLF